MAIHKQVWKIFTFAGWWMTFLAVAVALLFAYNWLLAVQSAMISVAVLALFGLIAAAAGEHLLAKHVDKTHRFVWEALSAGGIFCLAAGLLWLAIQLESITGIIILLAVGILFILVGESKAEEL